MRIGYLQNGNFFCEQCVNCDLTSIAVYSEHLDKHSQTCSKCKKLVVQGEWPTIPYKDTDQFYWTDMAILVARLTAAIREED